MMRKLGLVLLLLTLAGCDDDGIEPVNPAVLDVTPDQFLFARIGKGQSDERSVVLTNRGGDDLIIGDLTPEFGDQFQLFYFRNDDRDDQRTLVDAEGTNHFRDLVIAPGERVTLVLLYAPMTEDPPFAEAIVLDTNIGDFTLGIVVEAGVAEIAVNPTTLDFGRVRVGESRALTTQVTSIGQQVLDLRRLTLNGAPGFEVRVRDADAVQNPALLLDPDGDRAEGLARGRFVELTVVFTPEHEGPANGELGIFSNDPAKPIVTVNLRANAATPCIRVVPASLELPPTMLGRSETRSVTIESCGGEALTIRRVAMKDGSDPAFAVGPLPPLPAALPAAERGERAPTRDIDVVFTPAEDRAFGGTLVIESDDPATCADPEDPASCVVEVPIVGRGLNNACPVPRVAQAELAVLPLDVVDLDGSASSDADGALTAWTWTVISKPAGSNATPVEQFVGDPQDGGLDDDPGTPGAQLWIDFAGDYVVALHVTDGLGTVAPSETCPEPEALMRIHAEPDQDIHVELLWNTPDDDDQTDSDGTDVDLHFRHPLGRTWSEAPFDCYYLNTTPEWGEPGDADNPSLDIDDTDGAGPENINLDQPEDTSMYPRGYQVGAVYFRPTLLEGVALDVPSDVTLRIYLGGQIAFDETKRMHERMEAWHAAEIVWEPGDHRVVVLP